MNRALSLLLLLAPCAFGCSTTNIYNEGGNPSDGGAGLASPESGSRADGSTPATDGGGIAQTGTVDGSVAPGAIDAGSGAVNPGSACPPDRSAICLSVTDPTICPGLDPRPDINADGVPDCEQNLLLNGQFPYRLLPWNASGSLEALAFSATDDFGSASSGGALVSRIWDGGAETGDGVTSECIAVTPGATYDLYMRYYMASGQPGGDTNAFAWITVGTFKDNDCTVGDEAISGGTLGTVKDAWSTYERVLPLDANANSMVLSLGAEGGTGALAEIDNVLMIEE